MIKEISRNDIPECAAVIRDSFRTVADEPGFTEENAPSGSLPLRFRRTAYIISLIMNTE